MEVPKVLVEVYTKFPVYHITNRLILTISSLLVSLATAASVQSTTPSSLQFLGNESTSTLAQVTVPFVVEKTTGSGKASNIVEDQVRSYYADTPILAEVARCESEFRQFNTNGSILRGKANADDVGVMQINEYYHAESAVRLGYNVYTLEGNLAFGKRLYEKYGTSPWSASAPCWKKSLAYKESVKELAKN